MSETERITNEVMDRPDWRAICERLPESLNRNIDTLEPKEYPHAMALLRRRSVWQWMKDQWRGI